ncbi:MAG: HAMP domain-containing histidine kinase [Deltaproteobacteria bacterium]|nr:HAMP domain-containing histidine kinase [Deltaproteobacteria bacterium]
MKFLKRTFHPLAVVIAIQLAWILVVGVWIYWFLGTQTQIRALALKYRPELLEGWLDWVVLAEGLILLVAILAGVYVIFVFWSKQAALLQEQKAFIAQVSHELKSPVASIRLHLETLKLRRPDPEQISKSLAIMLDETERLNLLVTNLLTANRLEYRRFNLALRPCDMSEFTRRYFTEAKNLILPRGELFLDVSDGLYARLDKESFEIVYRNLLENAILYANGPPQLKISLKSKDHWCHLTFADQGKGLAKKDLKKIFRMFYRVRQSGEKPRGTGLGLFIANLMVKRHKGRIWAESGGLNQGTTFHIMIPRLINRDEKERGKWGV